jgi:Ni/Co efflux regulator RcnB
MNKYIVTAAVLALLAGTVQAQGRDERDRRGESDNRGRPHVEQRIHQAERNERRDERGAGPEHQFHRGDRLPVYYRDRTYVVDNWRQHSLSAPPRGYHWVQVGSDYVLVAIASGVILQLLLAH